MTEQQKHLSQVLEQQSQLFTEITKLNSQLSVKKELATKLQGVIEYLQQIGVSLPDESQKEVVDEDGSENKTES